jgi:GTP-dependent phosphoenolpyruvate carboxykinase
MVGDRHLISYTGIAFGTRNHFAVFLIAVIDEFKWSHGLAFGARMLGFRDVDYGRTSDCTPA